MLSYPFHRHMVRCSHWKRWNPFMTLDMAWDADSSAMQDRTQATESCESCGDYQGDGGEAGCKMQGDGGGREGDSARRGVCE